MANQWLRLWHDMPNDPKWRSIARASKQPISLVLSVYMHVLVNASNAEERGRTKNLSSEDLASALDVDTEQVAGILSAMQGRVMDGDALTGWEKRQPLREDGAAERAKAWREAKKTQKELARTHANADESQDKDKDKDKEKINTPLSPRGGSAGFAPLDSFAAQEPAPIPDELPEPYELPRNSGSNSHRLAGTVCLLAKRMGIALVNPGNSKLNALLNAGASVAQFEGAIEKAMAGGKTFSYALAIVEREAKEARELVDALGSKPIAGGGIRPLNKQEALEARNRAVGDEWVAEMMRAEQQGVNHAGQ